MRALTATLLPILAATTVLAAPPVEQVVLGDLSRTAQEWKHAAAGIIHEGQKQVTKWVEGGREFVKQHGMTCE